VIQRIYHQLMLEHLEQNRQMLFMMGPRQVGKTTTCRHVAELHDESFYLNWDNRAHRQILARGPEAVAEHVQLAKLREEPPIVVLDEIHKTKNWKDLLKGLFDTYETKLKLIVTGSAQLDVLRTGGDSLMGRYFSYRMHPLSVAELTQPERSMDQLLSDPAKIEDQRFATLLERGGYPEPFERDDQRFYNQWRRTRSQLLFQEDLRQLTRIRELGQVEVLADLLRERAGSTTNYSSIARDLGASVNTIKGWLQTLEKLYYCFAVRPWHKNVTRALRKRPKYYLWDWSLVDDTGARAENFVASALLKAVQFWTDRGHGDFSLRFIRDKEQNEVDFVVVRDGAPWFLVEVKSSSSKRLSGALERFQVQTGAEHAFQVALDAPYVDADCFEQTEPAIVPARTLLSQLM
jgi:uncharacterized protein